MKIKSGIYFRYEPGIADGTTYIYDINGDNMYKTSKFVYDVLEQIRNFTNIDDIIREIHSLYSEYPIDDVKVAVSDTVNSLQEMDVLVLNGVG